MFDNYPAQPANNAAPLPNSAPPAAQTPALDMFATIGNSNPSQSVPQSAPQIYGPQQFSSMPGAKLSQPSESSGSFKFLIIGLVTLLLVLGGGVAAYQIILKPKFQNIAQTPASPDQKNDPVSLTDEVPAVGTAEATPDSNSSSSEPLVTEITNDTQIIPAPSEMPVASTNTNPVAAEPTPPPAPKLDTDNDGLLDDAEILTGTNPTLSDTDADNLSDGLELNQYKTDPLAKDTDNDGLTDGEEINTYQTDPLTKDTDGDTYNDGQEVKNGYNPNGPGRLLITKN